MGIGGNHRRVIEPSAASDARAGGARTGEARVGECKGWECKGWECKRWGCKRWECKRWGCKRGRCQGRAGYGASTPSRRHNMRVLAPDADAATFPEAFTP